MVDEKALIGRNIFLPAASQSNISLVHCLLARNGYRGLRVSKTGPGKSIAHRISTRHSACAATASLSSAVRDEASFHSCCPPTWFDCGQGHQETNHEAAAETTNGY